MVFGRFVKPHLYKNPNKNNVTMNNINTLKSIQNVNHEDRKNLQLRYKLIYTKNVQMSNPNPGLQRTAPLLQKQLASMFLCALVASLGFLPAPGVTFRCSTDCPPWSNCFGFNK